MSARALGKRSENSRKEIIMGIGGGIALIVVGLVFLLNVIQVDIPWVNEYTLGLIFVVGGIAAIILSLTVWRAPRGGATVVERRVERGVDDPPL
jgi:uncharacterized membrane protein HdeD (DUF308 family)